MHDLPRPPHSGLSLSGPQRYHLVNMEGLLQVLHSSRPPCFSSRFVPPRVWAPRVNCAKQKLQLWRNHDPIQAAFHTHMYCTLAKNHKGDIDRTRSSLLAPCICHQREAILRSPAFIALQQPLRPAAIRQASSASTLQCNTPSEARKRVNTRPPGFAQLTSSGRLQV